MWSNVHGCLCFYNSCHGNAVTGFWIDTALLHLNVFILLFRHSQKDPEYVSKNSLTFRVNEYLKKVMLLSPESSG